MKLRRILVVGLLAVVQLSFPALAMNARSSSQKTVRKPLPSEVIDINRASAEDLQKLPGIGPELARRIIEYRQRSGPFKRVEDLMVVRGIGPKKWKGIRPYVRVDQKGRAGTRGTE